jgi:hypothetical protein
MNKDELNKAALKSKVKVHPTSKYFYVFRHIYQPFIQFRIR